MLRLRPQLRRRRRRQIDGHGQWLYLREDHLLPSSNSSSPNASSAPCAWRSSPNNSARTQRDDTPTATASDHDAYANSIADPDRRLGLQLDALEKGIDARTRRRPHRRAARREGTARARLANHHPRRAPDRQRLLSRTLARLPDLAQPSSDAPPALKRQIFDAFELRILYDKIARRIEISATVSEAVASTLQNANDLPQEVANVTHKDRHEEFTFGRLRGVLAAVGGLSTALAADFHSGRGQWSRW